MSVCQCVSVCKCVSVCVCVLRGAGGEAVLCLTLTLNASTKPQRCSQSHLADRETGNRKQETVTVKQHGNACAS